MFGNRIWGRVVTKDEAKQLESTFKLRAAENDQLVPVFDATPFLGVLPNKAKDIKMLHKDLGGNGSGDRIALFETDELYEAGPISLRHKMRIKYLQNLVEYKFKSGIKIHNLNIK